MPKKKNNGIIAPELINRYAAYLREQEKSASTIRKYVHDLGTFCEYMAGEPPPCPTPANHLRHGNPGE